MHECEACHRDFDRNITASSCPYCGYVNDMHRGRRTTRKVIDELICRWRFGERRMTVRCTPDSWESLGFQVVQLQRV